MAVPAENAGVHGSLQEQKLYTKVLSQVPVQQVCLILLLGFYCLLSHWSCPATPNVGKLLEQQRKDCVKQFGFFSCLRYYSSQLSDAGLCHFGQISRYKTNECFILDVKVW